MVQRTNSPVAGGKRSRSRRWLLSILATVAAGVAATCVAVPSAYAAITVPGSPTAVKATPGNGTVVVKWTAPTDNGGSAITGYTAKAVLVGASSGTTCKTTSSATCTFTSLLNGRNYDVTVLASNIVGKGPWSAPIQVIPGVPAKPTHASGTPGPGSVNVSWTAPATNGSPITLYKVTSSPDAKICKTSSSTHCSVTGLTGGTPYTFTVSARNARGTGAPSAPSASVTPLMPVAPSAPTGATAIASNAKAKVTWTAPASNGGSPISGYTVTSAPDALTCTTTNAITCDVTGLSNGTAYNFTVTATNAIGTGPASAPSNSVTPVQTIPVGNAPIAVSSDGSHVWVANFYGNTVTELNASDGSLVRTITDGVVPYGGAPDAVSSDGTHAWVANRGTDSLGHSSVIGINTSDGSQIAETVPFINAPPYGISSDGTHVWAAAADSVTEITDLDGLLTLNYINASGARAVSSDGTHVWLADAGFNEITELDASDGSTVQNIPVGWSPTGIVSDGTHVWVTNLYDNTVTELNASDGSLVQTIAVGRFPDAVTSDGRHVWVANLNDNTVTKLDASDGSTVQIIPVGRSPMGISSDGTHVWVANWADNTITEFPT